MQSRTMSQGTQIFFLFCQHWGRFRGCTCRFASPGIGGVEVAQSFASFPRKSVKSCFETSRFTSSHIRKHVIIWLNVIFAYMITIFIFTNRALILIGHDSESWISISSSQAAVSRYKWTFKMTFLQPPPSRNVKAGETIIIMLFVSVHSCLFHSPPTEKGRTRINFSISFHR